MNGAGERIGATDAVGGTGRLSALAKRAFDVFVSFWLLVALLPLLLFCALAIKLDSPGPVLFRCRRLGRGGEIDVLKFRKMRDGASGDALTGVADERFTRLGRVLAKTKLDELPQLWNVLRGDMSLVGPRPEDPSFGREFDADFREILTVRPGITGPAQLAFASESEILDPHDRVTDYLTRILPAKTAIDRLYVDRRSFRLDLAVLGWTLLAVLGVSVAVDRSTLKMSVRAPRVEDSAAAREPEVADAAVANQPVRGR
jgi:lipopolysaccharide/colanic/teichoic acid biosynthesis glycosyltransferase